MEIQKSDSIHELLTTYIHLPSNLHTELLLISFFLFSKSYIIQTPFSRYNIAFKAFGNFFDGLHANSNSNNNNNTDGRGIINETTRQEVIFIFY